MARPIPEQRQPSREPPGKKKPPVKQGFQGNLPGIITSTGGLLFGTTPLLVVPFFNNTFQKNVFNTFDATNFNCEEDCIYTFRQEDGVVGRVVTVHKVLVIYRDIGQVNFEVDVEAYIANNDSYVKSKTFFAKVGKAKFDNKIHTKKCDVQVVGERPQITITRRANKGPLSLISVTLVGTANEEQQV